MTDSSTDSRSRTVGIIRLIVFVVLVTIAVFFLVVFIRNRRSDNKAVELTQLSQNEKKQNDAAEDKPEAERDAAKEGVTDDKYSGNSRKDDEITKPKEGSEQTIVIPGGIEDSSPKDSSIGSESNEAKTSVPKKGNEDSAPLPKAGIGTEVFTYTILLSTVTYIILQRKAALQAIRR